MGHKVCLIFITILCILVKKAYTLTDQSTKVEYIFLLSLHSTLYIYIFKRFHLFIFRERKGEKGEKHQCVVASGTPPTGDLVCNPGLCPDWELNQRLFGLQTDTQPLSHTSQGYLYFYIYFTYTFTDFCID